MGSWLNFLLAGDAKTEVEAADPLTLAGDVSIVGAGKKLELINLFAETPTELTIATGAITRTQIYHSVDTESDAASDNLDTIAGGADGAFLLIRPANDGRTVDVRHNQGAASGNNILLSNASNYSMDDITDMLLLVYDAAQDSANGAWVEVARGAGGVATLTSSAPQAVDGTAAAVGVAGDAARADHVHALGPLVNSLDFDQQQAVSLRLEQSTGPDAASEVEGQIYYDTAANRPKVWVV